MTKVDLENEGQEQGVEERDLRYSTGHFQIYIADFSQKFTTLQHTFMHKVTHTFPHDSHKHKNTHRRGDDYRQNRQRRFV